MRLSFSNVRGDIYLIPLLLEWGSYDSDFQVDSGFLYCDDFWRNIRYGDCSSCDSAVRDFSDHICSSKTYLSADHAGYDCRFQGMRRLPASCNWFSDRKDSRFPSRRHDPGHGACDAGELVLGKYDRTDAVK